MRKHTLIAFYVASSLTIGLITLQNAKNVWQNEASTSPTSTSTPTPTPRSTTVATASGAPLIERLELITDQAATGDGGNAWGPHKTRIVRTSSGDLFSAYTVAGSSSTAREWRLAQRTGKGWQVVAEGPAGREPVNLLRGPNDRLHIVGWSDGLPQLWSSTASSKGLTFSSASIPGAWTKSDGPYHAAAINAVGDIAVLQSGPTEQPGEFRRALYAARSDRWTFHVTPADYRYCYTFMFLGKERQLSITSTRDVRWQTLKYTQPEGVFGYVFNAIKYWHSHDASTQPLQEKIVRDEPQSPGYPYVLSFQRDAYVDTRGRTHILYSLEGPSTLANREEHHAILENGVLIKDAKLPPGFGPKGRIIQDTTGRFYLMTALNNSKLADNARISLYPADWEDGTRLGAPTTLELGYNVEWPGFILATPRAGVQLADYLDGAFASGQGDQWVYFRIRLR